MSHVLFIILFTCLKILTLTLSLSLPILLTHTHTCTYVTAVPNGAIKVTLNGTTHNRTLVNSLPDQ